MTETTDPPTSSTAPRSWPWSAMALAVLIVANDFTAFSVALPAMEKDLDSDLSTIQWVVNAYGLVFGVMIVTGGRLADMFGRRSIFFAGAGIFAGFSLLGGVGQSDIWVIACRALMGIGGAMMWPAILGMTYDVLPESKAGLAGGLILGAAGFGNAIGPLHRRRAGAGELALDLLPQHSDRGDRRAGHAARHQARRSGHRQRRRSTTPALPRCRLGWC